MVFWDLAHIEKLKRLYAKRRQLLDMNRAFAVSVIPIEHWICQIRVHWNLPREVLFPCGREGESEIELHMERKTGKNAEICCLLYRGVVISTVRSKKQ